MSCFPVWCAAGVFRRVVVSFALAAAVLPSLAGGQAVSTAVVKEGAGPRVLDDDGKPVGGATVSFLRDGGGDGPRTVATVVTGPGGTFRVPPRAEDDPPVGPFAGRAVFVEAPGYALGGGYLLDDKPGDVRLKPATELRVKLIGPDGRPAAGVRVAPRMLVGRNAPDPAPGFAVQPPTDAVERLARRTDGEGVVVLPGLPRQANAHLAVLGDDRFAQLDFRDAVPLGDAAVTQAKPLRLKRGASVAGRVVYGDGRKPAAGVVVRVQGVSVTQTYGWGSAESDADGVYCITRLPPGRYNAYADLPAALDAEWAVAALENLEVAEGAQLAGKDLTLVRGGVVAGRLVAADTKRGLAGLGVGLHGPARPKSSAGVRRVVTGEDGSFAFRVPPGAQYVYFMDMPPEGYLREPLAARDVVVEDGGKAVVTLELARDPSPPVEGRVLGPDGQPAAGAWVSAEVPGRALPESRSARASAAGRFRFAALPPGTLLRATRDKLETAAAVEVKGGEDDVTLRLAEKTRTSLRVSVRDAEGKPVRGAVVELTVWNGKVGLGTSDPAWVTDGKGDVLLENLSADRRYSLKVKAEGFGVGGAEVRLPNVGGENAAGPVVLRRADRLIHGRVVNRAGEPAAGVQVEINAGETGHQKTTTDEQGRFRFKVVPGAQPLIYLRDENGEPVGSRSAPEGEELELVYDPAAVIK